MAGSPNTVKYTAGVSGLALANMNWCASVVLPQPGAPAMMLKEYSGRPPPRISSSPGTPVDSCLISTGFLPFRFRWLGSLRLASLRLIVGLDPSDVIGPAVARAKPAARAAAQGARR